MLWIIQNRTNSITLTSAAAVYTVTKTDDGNKTDTLTNIEIVRGTNYADSMIGGSANDTFEGGAGNDLLEGGAGDDRLYGEAGDDTLKGGTGNDYLNGGTHFI